MMKLTLIGAINHVHLSQKKHDICKCLYGALRFTTFTVVIVGGFKK